ncbi:hypothetical protein VTL71DRAFT_11758 [Oculimacula yallundae]|uniref:2-dehydropantoate 2-reductase n=1 Tax=Oculimacula yallundae TaxID=86028 RepID=A0ABR4CRC5_9HELO
MPSPPKIHILGLGNLGRLFAHALATSTHAPSITLLFHRFSLQEDWDAAGRQIEITSKDLTTSSTSSNYCIEVIDQDIPPPHQNAPQNLDSKSQSSDAKPENETSIIQNLIITTKTLHTVRALRPLAHRLNHSSTLLFAQNGMGTIDEVTTSLFSNPATRPRYLAAITSHGVYSTGPFRSVHAGLANVTIGAVEPRVGSGVEDSGNDSNSESLQTTALLKAVIDAPVLSATAVSASSLKYLQLEKLTINALINPLTAILHVKNGELLNHPAVRKIMLRLVEECSRILLSLPELQGRSSPQSIGVQGKSADATVNENTKDGARDQNTMTIDQRFAPARLEALVVDVARKTAANTSSMLQDVQAGRATEIDYINGYFVRRAKEMGISCEWHERLAGMVREGVRLEVDDIKALVGDD